MATDQEIIQTLKDTGHLDNPFGQPTVVPVVGGALTIDDPAVKRAVASYQSFHAPSLSPMIASLYGDSRASAAVRPDGIVGEATRALFDMPRCACPDYDAEADSGVAAAQGKGNWRGCFDVGDFHAVKVKWTNSPPAFLSPYFKEVLKNVQAMYAETGLLIHWVESGGANISCSFQSLGGSTIGLAQVVNGASCGTTQWARFSPTYRPSSIVSQWTSLVAHELGHGCGMSHTSGGHMNPSIMRGLPITWKGDPAWNLLASRFGGKAVPIPGDDTGPRKLVQAWQYPDGRLEYLQDIGTASNPFPV